MIVVRTAYLQGWASCTSLFWLDQRDSYRIPDAKSLLENLDVFFNIWLKCALAFSSSFLQRINQKKNESAWCVDFKWTVSQHWESLLALWTLSFTLKTLYRSSQHDGGVLCPEWLLSSHLNLLPGLPPYYLVFFFPCSCHFSLSRDIS